MSALLAPRPTNGTRNYLRLNGRISINQEQIAFLKQKRKLRGESEEQTWHVGGLNGIVDEQHLIVPDKVAQEVRDNLSMVEVFDTQNQVKIYLNLKMISGFELNGYVARFYKLEGGRRSCILTALLDSITPLGC